MCLLVEAMPFPRAVFHLEEEGRVGRQVLLRATFVVSLLFLREPHMMFFWLLAKFQSSPIIFYFFTMSNFYILFFFFSKYDERCDQSKNVILDWKMTS